MPLKDPGIELVSGTRKLSIYRPDGTARIRSYDIVTDITGDWVTEGFHDLDVDIVNNGQRSWEVPGSAFALTHGGEKAQLLYLIDVTGVDASDDRSDNDQSTTLYDFERDGAAPIPSLIVPARSRREFNVVFANFHRSGNQVKVGDALIAEIPLSKAPPVRIRFVAD